MLDPASLVGSQEMYATLVDLVLATPVLRVYIDADSPPEPRPKWKPPEPVMVTKNVTLYDEWMRTHGKKHHHAHLKMLQDQVTGAPIHPRRHTMRPEDQTNIDLTGAELGRLVRPATLMRHVEDYHPHQAKMARQRIKNTVNKQEEAISALRVAEAAVKGGRVPGLLKQGTLWKLNQSGEGRKDIDIEDWRSRVFVISDGIMSYLSEQAGGKPKVLGDLRAARTCTIMGCPPFETAFHIIFVDRSGKRITHTLAAVDDDKEVVLSWISTFSLFSTIYHPARKYLVQLMKEEEKQAKLAARMLQGGGGQEIHSNYN